MGGVHFDYLVPPRGARVVTDYAESFNRADQPFFLGNNWYTEMNDSAGSNVATPGLAANVNVGSGHATFGGTTINNNCWCKFFPVPIYYPAVAAGILTRGVFSQFTIDGITGGGTVDVGPAVAIAPNSGNGYWLDIAFQTTDTTLFRSTVSPLVNLVTNVFAPANRAVGDIVRLECIIGVASNTLRSYLNGVLTNTTIDASGSRPTTGGYGIFFQAWGAPATVSIKDFSGGII